MARTLRGPLAIPASHPRPGVPPPLGSIHLLALHNGCIFPTGHSSPL